MKYAFFGTPVFAEIILKKLITKGLAPALVVCNPDRPVGRKKIISPPPTKIIAETHGIEVFQPEKLSLQDMREKIKNCDLGVVAAYAKIIPEEILKLFREGVIGIHPSLLPKYRGATPIQSAIMSDDEKTGVSIYRLDAEMDHGPVIAQNEITIPSNATYKNMELLLAELGVRIIIELFEESPTDWPATPQDETKATYTKKFTSKDAFVEEADVIEAASGNHLKKAAALDRKIRALNPEPGAWTILKGKRTKLLKGELRNNCFVLTLTQEAGSSLARA